MLSVLPRIFKIIHIYLSTSIYLYIYLSIYGCASSTRFCINSQSLQLLLRVEVMQKKIEGKIDRRIDRYLYTYIYKCIYWFI